MTQAPATAIGRARFAGGSVWRHAVPFGATRCRLAPRGYRTRCCRTLRERPDTLGGRDQARLQRWCGPLASAPAADADGNHYRREGVQSRLCVTSRGAGQGRRGRMTVAGARTKALVASRLSGDWPLRARAWAWARRWRVQRGRRRMGTGAEIRPPSSPLGGAFSQQSACAAFTTAAQVRPIPI